MNKVVFMQGNNSGLPLNGTDNGTLYFVNDSQTLYKSVGAGLPLAKMSEVRVVSELPTEGILENKLYIKTSGANLGLFVYTGGVWKTIATGGGGESGSPVEIVNELPVSGDEVNKLYVQYNEDGAGLYLWTGEWVTIATAGSAEVSDGRVDILFNLKNKKDTLTYDAEGNIVRLVTTGEVEEETDYTYDGEGNIVSETILRQGNEIVNIFSYDEDGNIIEIDTSVVKL